MSRSGITRIVAVLTAAAVLFGLQQGLGLQFYFALPAAVLAYLAVLVGLGLLLDADKPAK
jgi:uncharacterized oligopeptide transporter (OPT) family protein